MDRPKSEFITIRIAEDQRRFLDQIIAEKTRQLSELGIDRKVTLSEALRLCIADSIRAKGGRKQ